MPNRSVSGMTLDESSSLPVDTANGELAGWIAACAQNNQAAFESLYAATSAQVFGVLLRILKSDALAEEALQETYVRVWNKAGDYQRSKSTPRTWLVSIARHHAIDVLRKRSTREDVEFHLDFSGLDKLPDLELPFEQRHELSQQLLLCLQQLNESARECVVRAYCEGFSQDDLSEHLQRPVGTIKSWLRRGLVSLKECLHGHT